MNCLIKHGGILEVFRLCVFLVVFTHLRFSIRWLISHFNQWLMVIRGSDARISSTIDLL